MKQSQPDLKIQNWTLLIRKPNRLGGEVIEPEFPIWQNPSIQSRAKHVQYQGNQNNTQNYPVKKITLPLIITQQSVRLLCSETSAILKTFPSTPISCFSVSCFLLWTRAQRKQEQLGRGKMGGLLEYRSRAT